VGINLNGWLAGGRASEPLPPPPPPPTINCVAATGAGSGEPPSLAAVEFKRKRQHYLNEL